ncbi:MAG TPA: hypothetical protein VJY65_02910 [Chloroflexota bacterium]|nr:hypothetical protein [Chloroflexota bacterium]
MATSRQIAAADTTHRPPAGCTIGSHHDATLGLATLPAATIAAAERCVRRHAHDHADLELLTVMLGLGGAS